MMMLKPYSTTSTGGTKTSVSTVDAVESMNNKTKYMMDPGIYFLMEADEDNTT